MPGSDTLWGRGEKKRTFPSLAALIAQAILLRAGYFQYACGRFSTSPYHKTDTALPSHFMTSVLAAANRDSDAKTSLDLITLAVNFPNTA
jgi:hypothetical protein